MYNYKLSNRGADIIKEFEGFREYAYRCPAGVLTIGWGHTGPDVNCNGPISVEKAQEFFDHDVQKFVDAVNHCLHVPVNQHQFDAMVSLAYNIGPGAIKYSTLMRDINASDFAGAAKQFLVWNKGGGRVLPGLVRRRKVEHDLFLEPVDGDIQPIEDHQSQVIVEPKDQVIHVDHQMSYDDAGDDNDEC